VAEVRRGKPSNSLGQATALESAPRMQRSVLTASAMAGRLQSRRSRGGRIHGNRLLGRAKMLEDVHKGGINEKKTEDGSDVVVVKRGRGRPRKVCLCILYMCKF